MAYSLLSKSRLCTCGFNVQIHFFFIAWTRQDEDIPTPPDTTRSRGGVGDLGHARAGHDDIPTPPDTTRSRGGVGDLRHARAGHDDVTTRARLHAGTRAHAGTSH